ncbi:hypothetical protein B7463_g6282, partial [Scytalidium lignicola]
MRLLHTRTLKLEEFGDENELYAILSHTWGENEITFQDIERGVIEKEGCEKVRKTCALAASHGFDYVWIDTCCIDKTSSAELSEAINSMYRWYQKSIVCYAYLADVPHMPPNATDDQTRSISPEFLESKWFKRGWTLQELIAPSIVIFLDQEWQEINTKSNLQQTISKITGIPSNILLGDNPERASIAQRMSWASKRETKRVEDLAYCLMGIFGVNMPMLYGEGEKAFIRLQEEIMKVSDDYSLFAWKSYDNRGGLLATSPKAFIDSREIIPLNSSSILSGAITVSKGIHLKLQLVDIDRTSSQDVIQAIIPCIVEGEEEKRVALYLKAMPETNEYFMRTQSYDLNLVSPNDYNQLKYQEKSICIRQERLMQKVRSPLLLAAKKGHKAIVQLLLEKGIALEAKDERDRTPLSWAASNGHKEIVQLLLEKGERDLEKETPLLWAVECGHEAIVQLLLEKGAMLETRDLWKQTPLLLAAKKGHKAIVQLLLEKGAMLEIKDYKFGRTPLSWAVSNGHKEIVQLLIEKGAEESWYESSLRYLHEGM